MTGHVLSSTRAASLAGAATLALLCAGAAQAQEGGTTALEELQVTGEGRKDTARGPVQGYVATRSSAGTKTDTPILETPRSVEVIGRQELEDRGVTTIPEAVRYSPGVTTNGSGFDPRFDQISIRGFPVNSFGDYKDGLRQMQGQYATFRTDPFQLERIDIIKGPAAVLYGQMTPGGLIDRISKRPAETPQFEAIGTIASTGRYEAGVDVSGPLNADKTLTGRVIALGRVGEVDFDSRDDRVMLAPSFTWAPTDDTKLTVYGLFQKDETDSNPVALNRGTSPNIELFKIRASDAKYDYQKQSQYQIGYEFEHDFNDSLTFRQNARYNYIDMNARYLTANVQGGAGWVGDVYRRGAFGLKERIEAIQIDNQFQARLETGLVHHTVLFGADHQRSKSKYSQGRLLYDPNYDLDINDPEFRLGGPTPEMQRRDDVTLRQTGIYLQDQIKIGDHWNIVAGIRHDWANRRAENVYYLGSVAPGTAPSSAGPAERDDKAFSHNIGVLYAFDNGISPYVSYSTSFLPSSSRSSTGDLFKPTKGEQLEAGVKYQPPGSQSLFTAALYRLVEKNAVRSVPATDTTPATSLAIGEIETLGVELSARVNLTQGLDVIASYNLNDAEITKDGVSANIGNQPLVTPKHTASAWVDYTFQTGALEGFGVGAGVRYTGTSFNESANTFKNDAYTLFDAGARYDLGKASPKLQGVTLAVNATNLADDDAAVCNSGRCYLSQGRTVIGTLRYRW